MKETQKKNNIKEEKVWSVLNSAIVICIITLISTCLFNKIEWEKDKTRDRIAREAVKNKEAVAKAEEDKKKENERIKKLKSLRAELDGRIPSFLILDKTIYPASTVLIKAAYNGSSASYNEFNNVNLPSLLRQLGELSKDPIELSKAKKLENQLLNNQNLLLSLSSYLSIFTSNGRELLNNSVIPEEGFDAAQEKSIITKLVTLKNGTKVPLDKNESVSNQKIVSLSQQNKNKLLKLHESAKDYYNFLQKRPN